jgi:tRNA 2-thiouridine synthesizing protein A
MTDTTLGDPEVAATLDTSGLLCPLPVYKAALALKPLAAGEVLRLITTDRGSLEDIPAMARQRGDRLVASEDRGDTQVFWIEKGTGR